MTDRERRDQYQRIKWEWWAPILLDLQMQAAVLETPEMQAGGFRIVAAIFEAIHGVAREEGP